MTIYVTEERSGHGKHNYYWNEYRQEGDTVYKYRCNRFKYFDGDENNWEESEKLEAHWNIDDSNMPQWLNKYIQR